MKNAISKTLLLPLYFRAKDAQSSSPKLNDHYAIEIIKHFDALPKEVTKAKFSAAGTIARARYFDQRVKNFIKNNEHPIIANVACGLDTRTLRCYDPKATFYDIDLPEVIELRKKLIPDKSNLASIDAFSDEFFRNFDHHKNAQFCFIYEGFFMYFKKEPITRLITHLQNNCHGTILGDFNFSDYWEKHQNFHDMSKTLQNNKANFATSFESLEELLSIFPELKLKDQKFYHDKEFSDLFGWLRYLMLLAPKKQKIAMQLLELEF